MPLVLSACTFASKTAIYRQCKPLDRAFIYGRTPREAAAKSARQSLPMQYEIYLCGMQTIHPSQSELAGPLAQQGAAAVPFLRERLLEEESDLTVENIVRVFAEMERRGTYDLSMDRDLILAIRERVERMGDPALRGLTLKELDRIQNREQFVPTRE